MDQPGFSKFEIAGAGAAEWLDHLIAGRLPRAGRVSLSYCCSPRGGIVSEMTVSRLADGRFWLLSAAAAERHDGDWLREQLSQRFGPVNVRNVTEEYGSLIISGPRARQLLTAITPAELSNTAFPWLAVRDIRIGATTALAMRVSYTGELGWELHVPMRELPAVYERVIASGRGLGLRHFGLYALDSLRLEKCYRSWKVDLTREYSPLEASLERFVSLDKPAAFIGREALRQQRLQGVRERLVPLLLEAGDADASTVSIVYHQGASVGLVTSGGYGYRLKRSIALAYVRADLAQPGVQLEVEILGERRRTRVGREPLYDPENRRLRD
jgi:dimethylglycine dehydrogenase